jgi:TfoX/Sxy family transcriptional regulator of competence genes
MSFDRHLAKRIRAMLSQHVDFVEKKMFGGLAFLVQGNMCCGVHQDTLIVRLKPESTAAALERPHTRTFDLSGRPMRGWLLVDAAGLQDDAELADWISTAVRYATSLPAK